MVSMVEKNHALNSNGIIHLNFIKLKRGGFMLGLTDPGIIAAFLLSIGSALLCVVYGLINWNND